MTNELKNVPELRFPEFDGEWEEKTLGDIGSVAMNRRIYKNETTNHGEIPFYKIGTFGKKAETFISREKFEEYKEKYPYPNKGDILISASGSIGRTVEYDGEEAYYQDSNIVWLQHNNEVLNVFLKYFYLIVKWNGIEGTTIKRLYNKNILNTKIELPVKEEQQKIGEFFSKLDQQIELEEKKLELLEQQKKGYMQKIFSQKLRFKDENGNDYPNWEEVQLKDILIPRNYKQVPEINAPLMSFTSTGGIETKGDRYNREFLVKNKNKKYKRTEFNDLIYSSNNLDVGAIGLNRYGTSVISDVYEIFKIEEQVSPYFIEMYILQPEFMYKILRYRQGALYGQYRIHANDFLKINIELPCSEEQYKIGGFVNKLDNIIDIINNKIELLKQRKRGFLQKMFI